MSLSRGKGARPEGTLGLGAAVGLLRGHYGPPDWLPPADPFELILWENIAYLASPARRQEAFELLRTTIGTSPVAILAATRQSLEAITARGILKSESADRLRECARIAIEDFHGDLDAAIRAPLAEAKRALRTFPAIGEPGAEKVLLFAGRQALLAPESNGLRVLVRLGLVREDRSYARMYAGGREAAKALPESPEVLREAHLLLQQHGRTLCKRNAPICEACPLEHGCRHARSIGELGS